METTLPQLDHPTQIWFERIEEATGKSRPCPVPAKYFDILKTWGYVEGSASAAKLSGTGMGVRLLQKKETEAADKKARRMSSRRKK
jgi:hypothetical protein